jgi:hypothetical protein
MHEAYTTANTPKKNKDGGNKNLLAFAIAPTTVLMLHTFANASAATKSMYASWTQQHVIRSRRPPKKNQESLLLNCQSFN